MDRSYMSSTTTDAGEFAHVPEAAWEKINKKIQRQGGIEGVWKCHGEGWQTYIERKRRGRGRGKLTPSSAKKWLKQQEIQFTAYNPFTILDRQSSGCICRVAEEERWECEENLHNMWEGRICFPLHLNEWMCCRKLTRLHFQIGPQPFVR